MSSVATTLAKKLDRSVESVRDRIKRYLGELSKTDKNNIIKQNSSNPDSYVSFVIGRNGKRGVESFSTLNRNMR